jgi:predicted 3-demethylubiquinone-9 3-methyltransferase (glyoxalase superfamily)
LAIQGREDNLMIRTITPCLWFDSHAEEAANFYVSIFSARGGAARGKAASKILSVVRYGEAGAKVSGRAQGSVMTVRFLLEGQEFMALNGGQHFTFSPAVSFIVNCATQEEVDEMWKKLSEGGETGQCGWLTDKYGLSWQIVPTVLGEMMQAKDPKKSESVMQALPQMGKFDIKRLQQAFDSTV